MGRYNYQCVDCNHVFEATHSAKTTLSECPECRKKDSLQKIMSIPRINKSIDKPSKTGSLVVKTIEEMKKDIADQKNKLKNREKK